jgi:hypothetical protein
MAKKSMIEREKKRIKLEKKIRSQTSRLVDEVSKGRKF